MASGKATNPAEVDNGMDMESGAVQAPPASRFKGVVPQPNGRWGAQIYERHSRRVWLGTFADEGAAARAYDVAALRFSGRSRSCTSGPELAFLADHSKAEVVDMLRNHTYADELQQGLHRGRGRAQPTQAWAREFLFDKAVTPSDVGKLNRLVVRKQHAEKHFPLMVPTGKGVLLNFEDGQGKAWRFRYSYWHSSQSYVLTKGWSRFVREKGLRAGDTVTFSRSAPYGDTHEHLLIDYKKNDDAGHVAVRLFGVDIAGGGMQGSSAGQVIGLSAIVD